MRTFITKLSHHITRKTAFTLVAAIAAVGILPTVALAWGPERPTFTQQNPADYVTFNSITNNPKWGDERNFMRIRDVASGETFRDTASLQAGKKYEVIVLYHNNAKTSLNASGKGVAQNAFARTEIPAIVKSKNADTKAMSYVGASNANPASVYDHISFSNPTTADIALRYVKGTAKITSNGAVNGQPISESIFSASGTKIGYDALNGTLPGCDQYSGYITYQIVADAPGFTFAKDVRIAGTKEWKDTVTAPKGSKVEYRLSYANTGTTEQKNVVFKDVLPKGLSYQNGQTDVINPSSPNGKRVGDGINGDGVNIGSYAAGSNAFLYLFATVDADPCAVLTNTASVETTNGNRQDTATVKVEGQCAEAVPEALPTTGPVEVIAGLIGLASITFGTVYYFKSRRELEEVLRNAQTHGAATPVAQDTPSTTDTHTHEHTHTDKK